MPSSSLPPDQQNTLHQVFQSVDLPSKYSSFYNRLRNNFLASHSWLSPTNPLKSNQYRVFNNYTKSDLKKNYYHIGEYLVASSILHNVEGWNYLSRALSAILLGDSITCIHLTYYAELRAAMSILSNNGVSSFSEKHALLDPANYKFLKFNNLPTHFFIWQALEEWASVFSIATDQLSYSMYILDRPFSDWFQYISGSMAGNNQVSLIFKDFAFDLKHFAQDKNSRNKVSYNPEIELNTTSYSLVTEVFSIINNGFTPISYSESHRSDFMQVDFEILRNIFKKTTNVKGSVKQKEAFISKVRPYLSDIEIQKIHKLYDSSSMSKLFEYATNFTNINHPNIVLGMLSRAFILLRFSQGVLNYRMESNQFSKIIFDDWIKRYSEVKGLISSTEESEDLYLEYSCMVQELYQELSSNSYISPYDYNHSQIEANSLFRDSSRLEYIGLIGLA